MTFYHFQFYNAPNFKLSIQNTSSIWKCDSIANVILDTVCCQFEVKCSSLQKSALNQALSRSTNPHEAPELVLGLKFKSLENNCASSKEITAFV